MLKMYPYMFVSNLYFYSNLPIIFRVNPLKMESLVMNVGETARSNGQTEALKFHPEPQCISHVHARTKRVYVYGSAVEYTSVKPVAAIKGYVH